jgi:hypothetical protein
MVSARDRAHFDRIAGAGAELDRDSIRACVARSPGRNVEIGFELSDFALAFGGDLTRPDEVPPIELWRRRRATRS